MSSISATRVSRSIGSKNFEQLLLLFDGELEIGADGVGQLARLVHADGGDHGLVVQVLAELDVLLKEAGDAADQRSSCGPARSTSRDAHHGAEEAFVVVDRNDFGALHAFHQHFDVAVRQLQALDDVDDRADGIDLVGLGSSIEASCWVARKIFLSPASASSSARTLDSRPTTKGVIMYGKMTTSRMGIIGRALYPIFLFELFSPLMVDE